MHAHALTSSRRVEIKSLLDFKNQKWPLLVSKIMEDLRLQELNELELKDTGERKGDGRFKYAKLALQIRTSTVVFI